ncbi:ring finger protein [Reticulomyxa filosa]|uniref:RING-type E3 ubiquitin transferase n=1 Tax=Reticulomyxa filosa TaxID=46433 RepID=X6L8L3_RETFI|nr:ring finger protein [Reticulomyxa filosa]|eukprot:ETN98342.1 ring finger protein [Reticulomyxa filosa]
MGGVPGQMFGGALMGDNMDYETLLRMFPPVPRGAQATDIDQLPVDTFRGNTTITFCEIVFTYIICIALCIYVNCEKKEKCNTSVNFLIGCNYKQEKSKEEQKKSNENESKQEEKKKEEEKDEFHRCCICLESFKEGEEIRRLPCLHIFHTAEIDEWLLRNHLCPICRTPIEQNEQQQRP